MRKFRKAKVLKKAIQAHKSNIVRVKEPIIEFATNEEQEKRELEILKAIDGLKEFSR
jgi:hypothetical protein